jgi:dipeptidyl aminopeptidase/acylaminoacyl peptidase
VGGDVYIAPLAGGEPRDVTPGLAASAFSLEWTEGGLLAGALMGADDVVLRIDPAGAPTQLATLPVWPAGGGALAFSRDGARAALAGSTFTTPPALLLGPLGALRPITHENDGLRARVTAQSLTWRSDGFAVQGWLLTPTTSTTPGKAPMVTVVHGGPSSASTPTFIDHGLIDELAKSGYDVFLPNPRGSYGQGEAFTRANVRDLGGGDLRDILAGVDAAEKAAPIDDGRLGLYGHSYGGFMTMWGVTHTSRFKAAVAGAGVSDWVSYYGENGIDKWMIPFFGASAYEDAAIYDKLSPIRFIRAAKTPTFIYVGERDVECPAPQSIEFWHGLKEMNVPTRLVIYPGEGHGIRKPEDVRDLAHREIAWFNQYLRP